VTIIKLISEHEYGDLKISFCVEMFHLSTAIEISATKHYKPLCY